MYFGNKNNQFLILPSNVKLIHLKIHNPILLLFLIISAIIFFNAISAQLRFELRLLKLKYCMD
ncbi:hypothetical protein BpHYR1_047773 [Brachionus plicatilis]|uniref:Uncharacterized protein n=1 Tax=Brachionus plicatilis TaxID=10195 RepID=A0A3M7T887_BRAPC|nr:hypothetical protein BpHYR1_047773 [Brachionus plicatilis]